MKKTLVVVAGPTASGKTTLAIELARHFKTEIVSADSRQFYRELSIGTAKPTEEELKTVPHHFINSHNITDPFNAGDFGAAATLLINKLFEQNSIVVMAGGSGLYIDAVINGIDDLPEANPEIRKQLQQTFNESGISALQKLLQEKDPVSFQTIDRNNPRRLIRAIEVCLVAGKPYSDLKGKGNKKQEWQVIISGINWPREELYTRINARTESMITQGLLEEVIAVSEYRNYNALRTVGYKEMFQFLDGNITMEEARELIAKNTRNYAKRQLTWFRKYSDMIWIKPGETDKLIGYIEEKNSD